MATPVKYKVVHHVTVPSLSMKEPGDYYLQPLGKIESKPDRENSERPINVLRVRNLVSGFTGEVVLGKLLYETFIEKYPEDGYVGKSFKITKIPSGKKGAGAAEYNLFYVDEIAVEGADEDSIAHD